VSTVLSGIAATLQNWDSKPVRFQLNGLPLAPIIVCVGDTNMYQIGILAKQNRALNITLNEIKRSTYFNPTVFNDSFSVVRALKSNSFDAFVVVTDEFRQSHIKVIKQIKERFRELPVIVITENPNQRAKIHLVDHKKTILLNLYTEIKDINGIMVKLIHNIHVIPRLASRHRTAQPARFKIEPTRTHSAFMLDLAPDGACFRLFNKRLKRGDHVLIEVPLPDLKKTHVVQGEIVWEKLEKLKNEATASSQKVGVRFL